MSAHRLLVAAERCLPRSSFTTSIVIGTRGARETRRLRHQVFVREMGANLRHRGTDAIEDEFDEHCRHVIVHDNLTGEVVGSTRLLVQEDALSAGMFFTEIEFDLDELLKLPGRFMETGRYCVHSAYRNGEVRRLLWGSVLEQMQAYGVDHLMSCVNLPMDEDGAYARALVAQLPPRHFIAKDLRAVPRLPLAPGNTTINLSLTPPACLKKLLRAGALICSEACWDPVFNCADVVLLYCRSSVGPRYAGQRPARGEVAISNTAAM